MERTRRILGGTMLLAICSTVAALACRDQLPTQAQLPNVPRPSFSFGAPDIPVQGCAKWKVTLTGGSGITTTVVSTPSCGPIPPFLTAAATYDPVTKIISLPIALKNSWTREVVAPARVYAWNDSIAITAPAGLTNGTSGTYVRLVQMDSTIASGAANLANARLWKYDTLLAAHATPQILNPGVTGRSRNLTMQIVSGAPTVFTVLLRVQAQNAYPVSLVPPDSQPAALYADTNVVINNSYLGGKAVKNTILVLFKVTATQAQRQAAIDSVKGVVVGGDQFLPNQDGYYLVRIANDASGSVMSAAITKLQTLTQVDFAGTVDLSESHEGREPNDGSGWLRAQYSYKSSDGVGDTWALKMINAPLAWGCDTGSVSASKIAVVDNFFFSSTDISYANPNSDLTYWTADSAKQEAHGSRVSSVIGAMGNNGRGMSGVLWKSSLSQYDYLVTAKEHTRTDYRNIARLIFQAGMDGATVINLSSGIGWSYVPSDARAADKLPVADRAKLLGVILARLEAQTPSRKPLIVLSAGNDLYDAKWNGWPSAKNSAYVSSAAIRSRILVAGGVNKSGTAMWVSGAHGSNWGSYVDIVAPAENVPSINGLDVIEAGYSGTSYSAPFVTGVAGLLTSFDSRLTADSLRILINQGATAGGRGISDGHGKTIYILDAYEALKAAGARAHAPLCGNRVWGVDNVVATLRANNVTETLHTYPTAVGPIEHLQAAHGGHWLELNDPASGAPPYGQRFRLTFNPTDWTPTAGTCANCLALSGAARSGDALTFGGEVHSHDGDSSIAWSVPTRPAYSSLPVTYNLLLKTLGGGKTLITAMRDTAQDTTKQTFGNAPGALAYSPTGDFAVFSTYDHTVVGGWFDTKLFKIAISNGVVTPLFTLPSQDASWISISEDGKELAIGSTYAGSCSIQYFSVATGTKFDWPYVFGSDTVGSTTNNAGYPTCFLGGSASASRGHVPSGPSLNRARAEPLAVPPRRP